jgi:hypothetical protein
MWALPPETKRPVRAPAYPESMADAPETKTPRPRRWKRKLLVGVAAVLALLLILIALLPTLLSTGPGTRFIVGLAEDSINGSVELDDLSIGWFSGTRVAGLVVEDTQGRPVLQSGEITTDATVRDFLGYALGGDLDLGDVSLDANLPVVEIKPDGTTNLADVFATGGESEDSGQQSITGDITLRRFDVTVQQVDEVGNKIGPFASADLTDGVLKLADGEVANALDLNLRVNAEPGGQVGLVGTIGETTSQAVTLDGVSLPAIELLVAAIGEPLPVTLAGIGSGTAVVEADADRQTVEAGLRFEDVRVDPATGGEGFASNVVTLVVDATQPTDGPASVRELRLVTDDGHAAIAADVGEGGVAGVRNLTVDVDLPWLQAEGGGASVAGLDVLFSLDAAAAKRSLNDLAVVAGIDDYAGIVTGRLRTQGSGDLRVLLEADAADVRVATTDAPTPLHVADADVRLLVGLTPDGTVPLLEADVTLRDDAGQVLAVRLEGAGLDRATQAIESLAIEQFDVPSYPRLRTMFGGVAELPELAEDPGPLALAGSVSLREGVVDVGDEPVEFRLNDAVVAQVSGGLVFPALRDSAAEASSSGSVATIGLVVNLPDLAAAEALLRAFDFETPVTGAAILTLNASLDDGDAIGSATVALNDATAEGLTLRGQSKLRLSADGVEVESADLNANGGTLSLAGARYDFATGVLTLPTGELASDVRLNRVLANLLGQYVSPLLADPQAAEGRLYATVTAPLRLTLGEGDASKDRVEIDFRIDEMVVTNDVVGEVADQLYTQAEDAVIAAAGAAGRVPGVDLRAMLRDRLNLDPGGAVRGEIDRVAGTVRDSSLSWVDGVVRSTVTIDVLDPRRDGDGRTYALTFAGGVDAETLAMDIGLTVPVELIEKWSGENPGDLVDLFGDRPFRTIVPNGVTVALGGTTPRPEVDARTSFDAIAPRVTDALLKNLTRGGARETIERGLRGIFGD